jgi:hypothetical protein
MEHNLETQKYRKLYLDFWWQEAPSLIQILTLPSFFGVLVKNYTIDLVLFILTVIILANYIRVRIPKFVNSEFPLTGDQSKPEFTKALTCREGLINYGFSDINLLFAAIITALTAVLLVVIVKVSITNF